MAEGRHGSQRRARFRRRNVESSRAQSQPAAVPPPEDDLGGLLTAVARGDERAFGHVFDMLSARAYGLARRIVRDPVLAEDVAQEAFIDVWRTAARYEPSRGSALAWVLTIVHRRAVDRVRADQSAEDRAARASRPDTPFDQVAEEVEDRVQAERVRQCLDSLTELQRDSVSLAYYHGYNYRQVGALLETPLGTVKTRIRDGLIRLRDCLGVQP